MKKKISVILAILIIMSLTGCSYNGGDPDQAIKKIEAAAAHYALRTGERLEVRFFTLTESGKRTEVPPKTIETYFDDFDISRIRVENCNLFSFSEKGNYSLRLKLMDELSVKGKLDVRVYSSNQAKDIAVQRLDEIKDAEVSGKEVKVKDKDAAEVYALLKENGLTELSMSAAVDAYKYYTPNAYTSTLDLRYYVAVKILKDGIPVHPNNGIKIIWLDTEKNKCMDIFGNVTDAPGFHGVEYNTILGDTNGEAFYDSILTSEIDGRYLSEPGRFNFSKDYKFLILSEEAARYEVFVDAIFKDNNKKFANASYLLDASDKPEELKNLILSENKDTEN